MPQLSSGRRFGIAASNFVRVLENGSDTSQGEPPNAPVYDSGFTVGMIQRGESDWSDAEVREINNRLSANTQLNGWLEQ